MKSTKILQNKQIAILATDGFEEIELTAPRDELSEYGARVDIISDQPKIKSWKSKQWSGEIDTDQLLDGEGLDSYDMLILPGGVINADKLRRNGKAIDLIKKYYNQNKYIAAICHGPQLLIEADLVKGKTIAAHPAIKTDLINAGAKYKNLGVFREGNIISAQGAKDVSAFLKQIITILKDAEGIPKEDN